MNKNLFNSVKAFRPKRNFFDLTHDVKMSLNMGIIYPTLCIDCVPGDSFNFGCETLLRFAPMVAPVMHRINYTHHWFFVPYRLLWPDFDVWLTQAATGDPAELVHPHTPLQDGTKYMTYFGLPFLPEASPVIENVNAFPFAAFEFIWNEYYRDQNLQTELDYELVSGANTVNTNLLRRAWQHDYFTSALPEPQAGDSVRIPIAMDVKTNSNVPTALTGVPHDAPVNSVTDTNPDYGVNSLFVDNALPFDPDAAGTINDLRRADALQRWLERMNIGGKRMKEMIYNIFGVESPDSRLGRPEYIHGVGGSVVISEVLNTTGPLGEGAGAAQGTMAGHGIAAGGYKKRGSYYCQEHGILMSIMSVRPTTAYQQGIPRMFLKSDALNDYYWPQFAHIGEQAILNKEIQVEATNPDNVFGYTPRYSEYKYAPNRVAGDFMDTLDYWHLGRIFTGDVNLSDQFIACDPSTRIFAVEDTGQDHLYAHILHDIKAKRPMPKFGTPGI